MPDQTGNERQLMLSQALSQLLSAIQILDRANAPAHIAARVDLAVNQLKEAIQEAGAAARSGQMATKADPH